MTAPEALMPSKKQMKELLCEGAQEMTDNQRPNGPAQKDKQYDASEYAMNHFFTLLTKDLETR